MINRFISLLPLDKRVNLYIQNRNTLEALSDQLNDLINEYSVRNTILSKSIEISLPIQDKIQERHENFMSSYLSQVRKLRDKISIIRRNQESLGKDSNLLKSVSEFDFSRKVDNLIKSYMDSSIQEDPFMIVYKSLTDRNKVHYSDCLIFNSKGELLILRRTKFQDKAMADIWGVPGGHVDPGEDFDTAADRELLEETGICGVNLNFVGIYKDSNCEIHYYSAYLGEENPTVILDNSEHYQYKFISLAEIDNYPMPFNMAENLKNFTGVSSLDENIMTIEKARKSPIGTTVRRKDGIVYVKVKETGDPSVDWEPKDKSVYDTNKENFTDKKKRKPITLKQLRDMAVETSEIDLYNAIKNSSDPEVRKIAHEELGRRSKEEKGKIEKSVAQIGEIRHWLDGKYKKISTGIWVKVDENKGKEKPIAASGITKKIKAQRANLSQQYEQKKKEFQASLVTKYPVGTIQYKVFFERAWSQELENNDFIKKLREQQQDLDQEIREIILQTEVEKKRDREEEAGKKEIDFADLNDQFKEFREMFENVSRKIPRFANANEVAPQVTVDDYYLDTDAKFKSVLEYFPKKNGVAWIDPVREKWDEMKSSGKFTYTHSPKSNSEYLVDEKSGDVYRKADHWGRCASCSWDVDFKNNNYGIAVCNIKDFKRKDSGGWFNPVYREKIVEAANLVLPKLDELSEENDKFYLTDSASDRVKNFSKKILNDYLKYSAYLCEDEVERLRTKYVNLFSDNFDNKSKSEIIKSQQKDKISFVMNEFKEGKLKTSSGDIVTDKDQAMAIAISEAKELGKGLSEGMTIEDVARKWADEDKSDYKDTLKRLREQLEEGIKVESEHTDDEDEKRRIALDHLVELKDYYTRLRSIEKSMDILLDKYNQGNLGVYPILEKLVKTYNKISK